MAVTIDLCSVCARPAHASETDDAGRCTSCMAVLGAAPIVPPVEPMQPADLLPLTACCNEPIDRSGCCAGCGERVGDCQECGGEGVIEALHGSQAGLDSPRTRTFACPECCGEPDEPDVDYERDDGYRWADEGRYEQEVW